MKKYLQYLLSDIEQLIEQAPCLPLVEGLDDDDPDYLALTARPVKIGELIGLSAGVFPPEERLTDLEVIELVEAIGDLWSAWHLHWEMPPDLPVRRQYTAMVAEMDGDPVFYHPEEGGEVYICHLAGGKTCPFHPDEEQCYCKKLEDSAQLEFDLWAEYMRSQGLDPYREITPEEEARFMKDMEERRKKKERLGQEYLETDPEYRLMLEAELTEEEQIEFLFALEMADKLLGGLLDDLDLPDTEIYPEDEEEDSETPF